MNCHDFEKIVLSLARDRPLAAAAREQSLNHAEVCEGCAARLAEERALLARLRAVTAEMASEEPPARVETALLSAFRAQTIVIPAPGPAPGPASGPAPGRSWRWSSWKLAAVAGILILISVMAVFWRSTGSHRPQREERAVLPAPGASPTPSKPAEPPLSHDQIVIEQPKNELKRGRRRASVSSPDEIEVVTQFFPLREGEDLSALDGLQLVRVELPGSALGEVGLPIDPETANEPVKADVVLGQDGLARAIRFVR
jgi:hypothetical protein